MLIHRQQPIMIVHQKYPLNAGPSLDLLRDHFLTPEEHFFVRTHGPVPEVDEERYRLTINGKVKRPFEISLAQLRQEYSAVTVMATLQCAGLRRNELAAVSPIPGEIPWGAEAIGNAIWRGVPLRDILWRAGITVDSATGHIAFEGVDQIKKAEKHFHFGGSIPLEKALSAEVLLAYEMNGEPLLPIHGFPLRLVVPGYIGARSVKWLANITVQDHPSTNYFQTHAYKLFPPHIDAITVNWSTGEELGMVPLNAVICDPQNHSQVRAGNVLIRGYALNGSGNPIERIGVSGDGGLTWTQARVTEDQRQWAWCFWELEVRFPPGRHHIIVRAQDAAHSTQPDDLRHVWNWKGYLNNACQKITLTAV